MDECHFGPLDLTNSMRTLEVRMQRHCENAMKVAEFLDAHGVQFMNKLQMCTRTVSLGTCDTLLSHPASMSHSSVPREKKDIFCLKLALINNSL